jgi:CRISPR-associated protein Csb1
VTETARVDKLEDLLKEGGPRRLILRAHLAPVAEKRFQPAGFPEVGHVFYDDPKSGEKVCIVDSAASMANHLEKICWDDARMELHPDLDGLPYVKLMTDDVADAKGQRVLVMTTLSEGHRLASDYFLDAVWETEEVKGKRTTRKGKEFLEKRFGVQKIGEKTFTPPSARLRILQTIFECDPNSLVHGIFFAAFKDIKISRVLTAFLEAYGASRVAGAGVKFDPIGKTESGQPIFQTEDATAKDIVATFVMDLDQIRSFGHGDKGLNNPQKALLLGLGLWKILRLVAHPWRYRTRCDLKLLTLEAEGIGDEEALAGLVDIRALIVNAGLKGNRPREVYYPAKDLFAEKKKKQDMPPAPESAGADAQE